MALESTESSTPPENLTLPPFHAAVASRPAAIFSGRRGKASGTGRLVARIPVNAHHWPPVPSPAHAGVLAVEFAFSAFLVYHNRSLPVGHCAQRPLCGTWPA